MTQEDKNLLFKDLCARLPYEIRCSYYDICLSAHCNGEVYGIENKEYAIVDGRCIAIEFIKPYLFPLSSMTEEQKEEIEDKLIFPSNSNGGWIEILYNDIYNIPFWFVDFCNKNHFDYRGLIEKGLAIDCTNLNIY